MITCQIGQTIRDYFYRHEEIYCFIFGYSQPRATTRPFFHADKRSQRLPRSGEVIVPGAFCCCQPRSLTRGPDLIGVPKERSLDSTFDSNRVTV